MPAMLNTHHSIMLLIDPDSGQILDANESAVAFYRLSRGELLRHNIHDFNILGRGEVEAELGRALSDARPYFIFPHRIGTGDIRTVEVHSSPVPLSDGQVALLSILHDITGQPLAEESMLGYQARLEALVAERSDALLNSQRQRRNLFVTGLTAQALLIVLLLYLFLRHRCLSRVLKRERQSQLRSEVHNRQLSMAVEQSPDSIIITNARGQIEYVNDAFLRNTGYQRDEVIGQNPRFRQSGNTPRTTYDAMWQSLLQGKVWRGELINRHKDNTETIEYATIAPVRNSQGEVSHYLSIQQDVSAQRKAEAMVYQLSYFDPLTGLPNRERLIEWLTQYCGHTQQRGALLLLNIDRFKKFNEAHTLIMGDALLKSFAHTLSDTLEEHIALARTSGDEFALVFTQAPERAEPVSHHALALAECIQSRLNTPLVIDGEPFVITVSLGITTFDGQRTNKPADVLRRADVALNRAKANGGNQVAFFEDAMGEAARRRFNIELALQNAIPNQELMLYLQPQMNARGQVVGAESLLRWQQHIQANSPTD
ncbi:MAG: diguanylate cyclase domain-containing protein [Saccharospirillum sp.]